MGSCSALNSLLAISRVVRFKIATVQRIIAAHSSAIVHASPIRFTNSAFDEHKGLPMRYNQ